MSIFALVFIAFAMSTDAFAASIGKGVQLKSPRFINALKMGLIFGVVEGITPIIGWAIGSAGSPNCTSGRFLRAFPDRAPNQIRIDSQATFAFSCSISFFSWYPYGLKCTFGKTID